MRLRITTHLEIMSWIIAVAITRLTKVPGPPSTTAVMQKGMETAAVNMGRRAPAPTGPMTPRLDQRGDSHDDQGGENHPEQVGIPQARLPGHDDRGDQYGGRGNQAELGAIPHRRQKTRDFRPPRTGDSCQLS